MCLPLCHTNSRDTSVGFAAPIFKHQMQGINSLPFTIRYPNTIRSKGESKGLQSC